MASGIIKKPTIPVSFQLTLGTTWTNNAQTISNDSRFIASGYTYMISPTSTSFTAYGQAQIYADDISTNGQITFHCAKVPSSQLTVNVVRLVTA